MATKSRRKPKSRQWLESRVKFLEGLPDDLGARLRESQEENECLATRCARDLGLINGYRNSEATLRRDIASLENRVITQQSSMADLVLEKQQQAKKISDLNQENGILVSRNQILKRCLRDSSSIIRDVLDSN